MIDVLNPGICATCMHMTIICSDRGAIFYRCLLSDHDPQFPRYPRLPVRICKGWTEKAEGAADFDEVDG
jgi:hypothetical protein